jgi:hypothetical protein
VSGQKIFCGSGKNHWFTNDQGKRSGQNIRCLVDLDMLNQFFQEYGFTNNDGKRMIKINVMSYKEGPKQSGYSHSVSIDTYKPQGGDPSTQNGHNQHGSMAQGGPAPQQGAPQGQRPQGYDAGQNPQGINNYTPPSQPRQDYEDDIPF